MSLSYNSWFFKIYCNIFAKKIGIDKYGNIYYQKRINQIKIILDKGAWSFIMVLLKLVKFHRNGMHGYII